MSAKKLLCISLALIVSLVACRAPDAETQPVREFGGQFGQIPAATVPPTPSQPATETSVPTSTAIQPTQSSASAGESDAQSTADIPAAGLAVAEASEASPVTEPPASLAPTAIPVSSDTGGQPVSPSDSSPRIISFTASPETANVGDTVTISWEAVGSSAKIGECLSADDGHTWHPCGPSEYMSVPLVGTRTVTIPGDARYHADFLLSVKGGDGSEAYAYASKSISVEVICPTTWFFVGDLDPLAPNDLCPEDEVMTSQAAYQSFENGFMMWIAFQNRIYAFWESAPGSLSRGTSTGGKDQWVSSMPETDPSIVPPAGLYQPKRGFGLAWRNWTTQYGEDAIRDTLGWATAPEFSFEVVYQCSVYRWHQQYCNYQDPYGRIITHDQWWGGWSMVEQ
ncbi:MAG: hypothetical protein JXB07_09720 [Anaerolineae bacterium]|nr:hypothetical protein [Anaerolineae bacterium]